MADEDEIETEITDFVESMHSILEACLGDKDMQFPVVICVVQANNVVQVFRWGEEDGMDLLLARDRTERLPDDVREDYEWPVNIMIVDRNGRADHIVITPAGIKYLR